MIINNIKLYKYNFSHIFFTLSCRITQLHLACIDQSRQLNDGTTTTCITPDTPDFIIHYDNEEVSSGALRTTINQRARHGVQVTRNWGMNKSWRTHCVVIATILTGLPGPVLSGRIIGTKFERMRDTCINFTGRLVKLVPLRFQRRYGAMGSAPNPGRQAGRCRSECAAPGGIDGMSRAEDPAARVRSFIQNVLIRVKRLALCCAK